MKMILKNGWVMDENFTLRQADVRIRGERIAEIGEGLDGEECIDLAGSYLLPGFIDTHIHGAYGARVSDENPDIERITRFEATQGVTALALTTASSEFDALLQQFDVLKEAAQTGSGAKIAGIHAEGPFLSVKYKGAMNEKNILMPDLERFAQFVEAGGELLKIITVAPEQEGSLELIEYAATRGITVSMGHTNADYETAKAAIRAGATQQTHTFNAARPLHHREAGVLGAVLTDPAVTCEVICDYVHLHPAVVQLIYRLKGADRINMVSDSGHAAGLTISEFTVDGVTRYVKDGVVRLANGTIAGSAKTLLDGVKNLIHSGVPMGDVCKMASRNPARSLKLDEVTGSIAEGKLADLVVLDENYDVRYTFVNGACVYKKGEEAE